MPLRRPGSTRPGPLWILALLLSIAPAAGRAASTDDVWALIDALKPVAEAIVVDGDGSDWGAIPTLVDPSGDAGGDPTRDITGVAIAPLDDALLLRIDTAGAPPATGRVFWLLFDFLGQQFWDVKISLNLDFTDDLDVFPEGQAPPPRVLWEGTTVAVGSVVEARLPYAALDAQLPASMQGQLSGSGARPWLRLKVTTGEPFFTEIDHGSAVGSYRLIDTPYALDPSLPAAPLGRVITPMPLDGLWYLGQGSHGFGTHQGLPWAYDFQRTDNALLPEDPPGSTNNADNFGFGEVIRAPVAGTLFSLKNDQVDHPAYTCCAPFPPNFAFVEIPGDLGLLFSHTVQGSIPFSANDPVAAGATIGEVGNSGASDTWAHLHYEVQDIAGGFASRPLALQRVDVGLNPTASDPWRRRVSLWDAREGFFVQTSPATVPLGTGATLGAIAMALATGAGWALRRRTG